MAKIEDQWRIILSTEQSFMLYMKAWNNFILCSFFVVLISPACHGQFGIHLKYNQNTTANWNKIVTERSNQNKDILSSNFEFAIDYWLRLKNFRMEFLPAITYGTVSTSFSDVQQPANYNLETFGINANINIYPFDFFGDCNCPTFSKDGNLFSKGFFLQLTPGFNYHQQDLNFESFENFTDAFAFHIGFGAGLDIGLTDLITISPYVKYNIAPRVTWDEFEAAHLINTGEFGDRTTLKTIQFAIRLGFRPDYLQKRR